MFFTLTVWSLTAQCPAFLGLQGGGGRSCLCSPRRGGSRHNSWERVLNRQCRARHRHKLSAFCSNKIHLNYHFSIKTDFTWYFVEDKQWPGGPGQGLCTFYSRLYMVRHFRHTGNYDYVHLLLAFCQIGFISIAWWFLSFLFFSPLVVPCPQSLESKAIFEYKNISMIPKSKLYE